MNVDFRSAKNDEGLEVEGGLGEILSDAKVILRDACRQIDKMPMQSWEGRSKRVKMEGWGAFIQRMEAVEEINF